MKTTRESVEATIRKRVEQHWAHHLLALRADNPAGTAAGADEDDGPEAETLRPWWPHTVPLGKTSSVELAMDVANWSREVHTWREWAAQLQVTLNEDSRRVAGMEHFVPRNVVVPDLAVASSIAGTQWPRVVQLGGARLAALEASFPEAIVTAGLLRDLTRLDDTDFDVLERVARWFSANAAAAVGLTPRQVPVGGVHAKWLNKHQHLVRTLAGLDDLGLAPAHPARVHFTYLDPDYLTGGGRRHDCHNTGDHTPIPYQPRVVLISENKDTAVGFPPVPGGVAIEGDGAGSGAITALPWIREADLIVYWGDLDVDGLRILNEFRSRGLHMHSMLMDCDTYRTYSRYGTNTDRHQKPLRVSARPVAPHLEPGEAELLDLLTSGEAPVLRVEQERIPIQVAVDTLTRLIPGDGTR